MCESSPDNMVAACLFFWIYVYINIFKSGIYHCSSRSIIFFRHQNLLSISLVLSTSSFIVLSVGWIILTNSPHLNTLIISFILCQPLYFSIHPPYPKHHPDTVNVLPELAFHITLYTMLPLITSFILYNFFVICQFTAAQLIPLSSTFNTFWIDTVSFFLFPL